MLSDEEKKAIEIIKFLQYKCIEENGTGMMPIYRIDDLANAIKIILNLIEKQQKEIEELKEKIKTFKIEDENIYLQFGEITEKKRWQDKIKAKMKEKEWSLENYDCDKSDYKHSQAIGAWCVLQSLLEKGVDI